MPLRRRILSLATLTLAIGTAVPSIAQAKASTYKPMKGSEILWDKWGVPHIFAKNTKDMFYLYGYAQTEAHGELLMHVMAGSRGRSSEIYGAGANDRNLKTDRWVWLNEVPKRSALWLSQQIPEFRSYLDSFAAGINAYAAAHPDKLSAEAKQVLPITPLDVIEHTQHFVNFEFVAGRALMEPRNATRTAAASTETASLEMPESPFAPTNMDMQDGSNGWAIAPSHSTSGNAMLLMNPHLAMAGEQTYFEAQLVAPGINLFGASQVGLPVMRFCFSDYLAITNTVNTNNGALQFDIKEQAGGYLYDGKVLQYETSQYPFRVKQKDGSFTTEVVQVQKTVHGPIIRRDKGVPVALLTAGLDKPFFLEQYWKMDTAHNFAEYQAQLRRLEVPMYNILYADRDGHIEYLFNANVPRRTGDWATWTKPVDGSTSATMPHGILSYDELPKQIDPASGYVQNSNEPPWDAAWPNMMDRSAYPAYISSFFPLFRSDRALRMLSEDKKISFDMLLEKKFSTRMEMADRVLDELLADVDQYGSPRAKEAAAVLRTWDRQCEANSRGALLFYTWAQKFISTSVGMTTVAAQKNWAIPYDYNQPLTTPRGIKDPKLAVQMLADAADETVKLYGALDRPWGDVMKIEINGQSDGDIKAVRGPALNGVSLPGNGGYGNLGVFRVFTWGPLLEGKKTPIHGDGFTIAVEFTKPAVKAKSFVFYGESSQPGSPFHTDELPLAEKKQWRDVWRTRPEILANLSSRDAF
ncbi:penicilin amidase [Terriglobus roseus DSM 18391]|uniref:Penicilin amidase n=1 Tax=Terriglobus roseus (strain DSM 18391 / NRRL B-41598 / KBS 63) TaxID=926566 RepID=I3ZHN0_TERRK|nr:penicillin acylase family protein [Terriglobus roseus]AFL88407.1 penicilin amidase [Terriglobus roseus DSM 18391]AFL88748.1 penicilin amidase [Terriglobus roseus DSM 18391]